MMHMNSAILLVVWWGFVGILGYGLFALMRFLSNGKYRTDLGDISTEVGYSVDSYGVSKQGDAAPGSGSENAEEGLAQAVGHAGGPGV